MVLAHIQKKGFMDVIRNTGVRGLYHGFEPTIYRDISFNMSFFTVREIIVRVYRKYYGEDPNPFQRTVMGIIGGTVASVFACPFDVVKTRVQGKELHSAGEDLLSSLSPLLCTVLPYLSPSVPRNVVLGTIVASCLITNYGKHQLLGTCSYRCKQ